MKGYLPKVLCGVLLLGGLPALGSPEKLRFSDAWEDLGQADRWSLSFGVARITSNTIDELIRGKFNRASGEPSGYFYLLGTSYTLGDLDLEWAGRGYRPQVDAVAVLGLVDESGRSSFLDYNLGVTVRWKDFPWNEFLYTNFETGVGLSYSERVVAIEEFRHPGRGRSHLKFYWPIELSLAHPKHRQHQLVLLLHHQSGGRTFDRGGSNHVGIGYRYVFRERR